MKAYFFGCWNEAGHYLFHPGGGSAYGDEDAIVFVNGVHIDGSLAPRRLNEDHSRIVWCLQDGSARSARPIRYRSSECDEGLFLIHNFSEYTYMSWWDRKQGDKRPGCNSTFILEGTHDAAVMLEKLTEFFPHVVENLRKANIELRQVVP